VTITSVTEEKPAGTLPGTALVGEEEAGRGVAAASREKLDELSRELRVEAHRVAGWRDEFLPPARTAS
jgi:hypothetical protein